MCLERNCDLDVIGMLAENRNKELQIVQTNKQQNGDWEVAQQLRVLGTPTEDRVQFLASSTQGPGDLMPSSGFYRYQANDAQISTQAKYSHAYKTINTY